jgi:hypothetical protein
LDAAFALKNLKKTNTQNKRTLYAFFIVYSVAIDNSIFVPFETNAMAEISIFSLQYEGEYPVISFHC